jgi:hypothetical protein
MENGKPVCCEFCFGRFTEENPNAGWTSRDYHAGCMAKDDAKRERKNRARRERHQAMKDLGLTRVRGNLGGTYYE